LFRHPCSHGAESAAIFRTCSSSARMAIAPWSRTPFVPGLDNERIQLAETVVLVDVDGVLNVGVRKAVGPPLLLNERNVDRAKTTTGIRPRYGSRECSAKVSAVARRLGDCVCAGSSQWSALLIRRLVRILRAIPGRRSVVLSSNWRRPRHIGRVRRLERDIASELEEPFEFDARTQVVDEDGPSDRLRCIKDYLRQTCEERQSLRGHVAPLRVVILDDFFITGMDGWRCSPRHAVYTVRDAEAYVASDLPVSVKVIYCYDEWAPEQGFPMKVGRGLSEQDTEEAISFVRAGSGGQATLADLQECAERAKRDCDIPLAAGCCRLGEVGAVEKFCSPRTLAAAGVCWGFVLTIAPWLRAWAPR